MTQSEIRAMLDKAKEEARIKYKARIKGYFGSHARNEEKPDSDIDILVDFDSSADLFDFVGLSLFLEEKMGHKVDIVPEQDIRKELKDSILRETVYI